jgi:ATP-binding cassette subfamily B protein
MTDNAFQEEEFSRRFDIGVWRGIFRFATPYRQYFVVLAATMICCGGIDAIFPYLTKYAIDTYVMPGNLNGLGTFGTVYICLVLLQSINVWFLIYIAGRIEMWMCRDIRSSGFSKLQELSFSYFDRTPVGWIMARMTSDSERLSDTIAWGLVDFIWGVTMMMGISGILFYLNWKLALIVLSVVPLLVAVSSRFQRMILASYRKVRKINSQLTGSFNEGIMGAKTTKTLVREEQNLREFQTRTSKMFRSSVMAAVQSSLYLPFVMVIATAGAALALWFGGTGVIAHTVTYGTLVAFITYMILFFEPVQELARIFGEFQNAQASAERVISLLETEPEVRDTCGGNGVDDADRRDGVPEGGTSMDMRESAPLRGDVEFRNVTFAYRDGVNVLERFNLKVKAGQKIALVGETGSGKTSIVNLICRFYEPVSGEILIDGVDYRKRRIHWLQSNIGVVLQNPHLFNGTVLENIRYGKLEAADDEVIRASKLANAHGFITKLEKGYTTKVGEGGGLLSTGQKQLISFARVILADPAVFILDEATSSVDAETEQLIQDAIERILRDRTSFIIAHRLSTVRSADRIILIDAGKIIESGTHRELLLQRGRYYRMYTRQFIEQKEMEILE